VEFLKALSVFIGTIIGAGIFGLPYCSLKAGFPVVFIWFIFLSFAVAILYLSYAKVIRGTKGPKRLPGYAEMYLGKKWKYISLAVIATGISGSLLAYLIIGGEFLFKLFSPFLGGSVFLYSLFFLTAGSLLVFRGIKSIAGTEVVLLLFLLLVLAVFFGNAFNDINGSYFLNYERGSFFFPYGIILFSLWGASVIPELNEIVKSSKKLNVIIISGIILSALIYFLFIAIVFGISGEATSKDAISGLSNPLLSTLGYILGIITCFTSFLTLSLVLKKTLCNDFKIPDNLAWAISCLIPLVLLFFGFGKFIEVISFTGAVALGFESVILMLIYKRYVKNKFSPLFYFLTLVFVSGAVFEIIYLLK